MKLPRLLVAVCLRIARAVLSGMNRESFMVVVEGCYDKLCIVSVPLYALVCVCTRYGVRGLVHRNPYMALLKDYLEAFCPHGR